MQILGSVVTWGHSYSGGDSSSAQKHLHNISKICASMRLGLKGMRRSVGVFWVPKAGVPSSQGWLCVDVLVSEHHFWTTNSSFHIICSYSLKMNLNHSPQKTLEESLAS